MSIVTNREEHRKIQVTGSSTYTVSLPKDWIEFMGLKKGSTIRLTQNDDMTLLLQPNNPERDTETKVATIIPRSEDTSENIIRRIVSAYLMGHNIIQLRNVEGRIDSSHKLAVKDFARRKLVGTEVVSDRPQELTLQVLFSYSELSIQDTLQRMSVITANMHRNSINALEVDDSFLVREIFSVDDEVDRFNLYVIRLLEAAVSEYPVLKMIGLNTQRECLGYRLITKSIESIADQAVNITRKQKELGLIIQNQEIIATLKNLSDSALDVFETSIKAVLEEDCILAEDALNKALDVRSRESDAFYKIYKYADPEDSLALRFIVESIIRTVEYGKEIAEVVLNMTITEPLIGVK